MNKFYILNGEIERVDSIVTKGIEVFVSQNSIVESIRLYNTIPLFLNEHLHALQNSLIAIEYIVPSDFLDYEKILRYITRLLNINKVYKGGICKIVVYKDAQEKLQCAIFIESINTLDFNYNFEGFKIRVANAPIVYPPYFHSECSSHTIMQQIALANCVQQELDAFCLKSIDDVIVHSTFGDIGYIIDNTIFFVDAIANPFRNPITSFCISQLIKNSYNVQEVPGILEKQLLRADEVFVLHHIHGIKWVSRIDDTILGFILSKKIYLTLVKAIDTMLKK